MPIEQATTPSLEALEAFSQGLPRRGFLVRDFQSIPFMLRAIELDPRFRAGAWSYRRGLQQYRANREGPRTLAPGPSSLIDGVSEPERLYILSHYYGSVVGDNRKSIEIYQQWNRIYPRDWSPYNNMGLDLNTLGDLEGYLVAESEAHRLAPDQAFPRGNIGFASIQLGRLDEAEAALEDAIASGFAGGTIQAARGFLAAAREDGDGIEEAFSYFSGTPGEPFTLDLKVLWASQHGRVGDARSVSRRSQELAADFLGNAGVASAKLSLAAGLAELGHEAEAAELSREALALTRDVQTLSYVLEMVTAFGDPDEARALIAELDERWPENTIVQGVTIPRNRAQLALLAGDAAEAIDLLETARPYERADVRTVRLRGQALLAKGEPAAAVAEFEKMIDQKYVFVFDPANSVAYLWLGRAHRENGDPAAARAAYEKFFEIMRDADEGVPVIEKARREYEAIPGARG